MAAVDPIPAIIRVVASMPAIRLAVLFGSVAKGRARVGSDLDLGVLFDQGEPGDLAALRVRLEREAGRVVDLIDLASAAPLLRMEIGRHGRVLLEREAGEWALFRAHAMIDWWDWEPTARMMRETAARRLREEAGRGAP